MRLRVRVLTDDEIRRHSFGLVKSPVAKRPATWAERESTLFCERIFGPERDWACACGKYEGEGHGALICDVCGVKLTQASHARARRFGHINLSRRIVHAMGDGETIGVVSVLPIAYRETPFGAELNAFYAGLVLANMLDGRIGAGAGDSDGPSLERAIHALFGGQHSPDSADMPEQQTRTLLWFLRNAAPQEIGIYLLGLGIGLK